LPNDALHDSSMLLLALRFIRGGNDMQWHLRPATEADLPRIAELVSKQNLEPVTAEELKRQEEQIQPDDKFLRAMLQAEDGQVVGYCMGFGSKYNKPGHFRMNVRVDEPYWNQGAGSVMYRHVEAWARGQGATHLSAVASERHPHSRPWAERRGFVLDQHIFESTLDLRTFDPAPFADSLQVARDAGIRFTTLAALGDDEATLRRYFDWMWEVSLDIPGREGDPKPPFDLFAKAVTGDPRWSKERVFLAMDGDRFAGSAELALQKDGSMYHAGTGIDRAYRGRRLSHAIKLVAIQYAMAQGVPYLRTNNNSKNAPILAVNRAFGYKPEPGFFEMVKHLA
jgi:GNAT superfamily N-acetyltransferase